MASIGWRTGTSIDALLHQNCHAFDFAQAVNLLCSHDGNGGNNSTDNTSIDSNIDNNITGEALSLEQIDKKLQFESHIGEEYSASEITAIKKIKRGRKQLTISFFGLFGQQGPLPQPYQQWVRENTERGDLSLNDFLNIFDNRLIALLYSVISKQQSALEGATPELSRQGRYQAALIGLNPANPQQHEETQQLPARSLLAFSGLIADHRLNHPRLQNILETYLDTTVFIDQFIGGWIPFDRNQQTPLTTNYSIGSFSKQLGRESVLGSKVWKQNLGLKIYIGPLPWPQLKQLLPGEKYHEQLKSLLFTLTEQQWRLELCLLVQIHKTPQLKLTSNSRHSARLAQSSWLNSKSPATDRRFFQAVTDNVTNTLPQPVRQRLIKEHLNKTQQHRHKKTDEALIKNLSQVRLTFRPEHFSDAKHD